MVLREQALEVLNLDADATREEIDTAFQRMVRRYPPEFHPQRFRRIDESYRTLTSLAFVVETILGDKQSSDDDNLARSLADLTLVADETAVQKAMKEMRIQLLIEKLWPGGQSFSP